MSTDYKQLLANRFHGREIKFRTHALEEGGPAAKFAWLMTYIYIDGNSVHCAETHITDFRGNRDREQQAARSYFLELEKDDAFVKEQTNARIQELEKRVDELQTALAKIQIPIDYKQLLANKFPGREIKFSTPGLEKSEPVSKFPWLTTYIYIDEELIWHVDTHIPIGDPQVDREQQAVKTFLLQLEK